MLETAIKYNESRHKPFYSYTKDGVLLLHESGVDSYSCVNVKLLDEGIRMFHERLRRLK